MKLKGSYFYTLRENAKDEDSISGNLLVRAGFMKKVSAGIYMYLPNGLRVLNNIKNIVKEEMDKSGAQELLMPSLIPSDIYEVCGRVEAFGNDMFSLKDRFNRDMVLGPTHEELDNLHSLYVDQWDWEAVITEGDRTRSFLENVVRRIYAAILRTEFLTCETYPQLDPFLPQTIHFIHAQDLLDMYPTMTAKEREDTICKKYGAVFIEGIGCRLIRSGNGVDKKR